MVKPDAVEEVKPLSTETIAAAMKALPPRLEEAAEILADMTSADLQRDATKRAVAIMVGEMKLAALLLRGLGEPEVNG